jgi:drug/metabolite transporter (DMT)-like permease
MEARSHVPDPTARLAVLSLLASGLIWGLTWIPLKHFAGHGLSGVAMTVGSYGLVGLLAVPAIWFQRTAWFAQWGRLALVGILGGTANLCFVSAIAMGEVVPAMLLFYLAPVWSMLGGRLFLGEPMSVVRGTALVLAIAGAFLVLGGPAVIRIAPSVTDALAVASGLLYAGQIVASRAADRVPVLSKALAVFTGCTVVSGAILLAGGEAVPPVSALVGAQLALFGVFWILAAMLTTMYGVTHLEAGRAGVLLVFELVAAVLSAMLIADERLTAAGWTGAALITGAALLETRIGARWNGDRG